MYSDLPMKMEVFNESRLRNIYYLYPENNL